ncbi:hypothetical protein ABG768_028176 [Culter alburnus]|uniref:Uncharacterized protein n=1 Tax=Culter alburnus TaxID=194366 RepID=A0AAW2A9E8_CULAL
MLLDFEGNRRVKRSRLKPEIYNTVDGKVIVEDEFLNFLAVKIKTLSQDEIVLLAAKMFDSDWIEASKKVLFELCPTTQQNVSHKGPQKDVNNIKSCVKVMNECGEDIPRFVSHYLDELPPVSFDSIDVSSLLGRMEQLSAELCSMTHTALHVNVGEDLRAITVDINQRVCALGQSADVMRGGGSEGSVAMVRATRSEGTALGAASVETLDTGIGEGAAVAKSLSLNVQRMKVL